MTPSHLPSGTEIHTLAAARATPAAMRALAEAGPVTLWYCADDYTPLAAIRRAAPDNVTIAPMNARMNEVAAQQRRALIDLDATLFGDTAPPEPAWSASNVADRGPYLSPFQRDAVQAVVIAEGMRRGGRHVVVADDRVTAAALVGQPPRPTVKLAAVCAGVRARLAGLRGLRRQRRAVSRARAGQDINPLTGVDTVLVAWVDAGTFAGPAAEDANTVFGPLPTILGDAGRRVGFLALPINWTGDAAAIGRAVASSGAPAVLPVELLRWRDVAAALPGSAALVGALRAPVLLGGVDVTAVARLALWRDLASWGPVQARLFEAIALAIKARAPDLEVIGYTYENQPWEKRLIAGAKWTGVRAVGVQHSPFAYDYVALLPPRRDIEARALPDALCVPGPHFAAWYEEAGFPPDRLITTGALRFANLFNDAPAPAGKPEGAAFTVVCALSIEGGEAAELVHKVSAALSGMPDVRLVVNFHPALGHDARDRIAAILAEQAPDAAISEQSIRELRGTADLVVYNTTGAAFESLAAGVPALFIGRHAALDHDKVPERLRVRAVEPEDAAAVIRAFRQSALRTPDAGEVRDALLDRVAPIDAATFAAAFSSRQAAPLRPTVPCTEERQAALSAR